MSNKDTVIHYSHALSLTIMKSEGTGDCGESGVVSGYWGLVKGCKRCKRIIEKEKKELQERNYRKDNQ